MNSRTWCNATRNDTRNDICNATRNVTCNRRESAEGESSRGAKKARMFVVPFTMPLVFKLLQNANMFYLCDLKIVFVHTQSK